METVYDELDEVKAEVEKLKEEYRAKAELAESLKRAHSEQIIKTQKANNKLEKLVQELNGKEEEICAAKQVNEDLKSNLKDKETALEHLTSANGKLRFDCAEKLRKYEEENIGLGLALDEANAKNMDQDKQICSLKEEIDGVRRLLTVFQNKCSEAEGKAKLSKEQQLRDDVFCKLEEENRSLKDQMKWKKEQFGHLEEAHQKLRCHLQVKEKEWEKEKTLLIDDLSSLQSKLDSQIRISEDLQGRLHMCNQALAHEEGKRKLLEAQLLEFKTRFNRVSYEYDDAKLKIESLSSQRDQEIASLRGLLGTKEALYKEMQYQFNKQELEKQELMASLKELQEAQIEEAGKASSLPKLRNKLKCLEQAHRNCLTNLKEKEAEWHLQIQKLEVDLSICRSALESKDIAVHELEKELEACHSLTSELELQNEENSLLLLVLKSEFSEAQLSLANNSTCMDRKNKEMEETISVTAEQLEMKEKTLDQVKKELEEEREKTTVVLSERVEFIEEKQLHLHKQLDRKKETEEELEIKKVVVVQIQKELEEEREKTVVLSRRVKFFEEQQLPLQRELERLKEMLRESSTCKLHSEEQVRQIQSDLKTIHDALARANEELYEKICEVNEVEFELQIWKTVAEQFKSNIKENHRMRKEVETSLLAQIEVEVNLKREKENLCHQLEEKKKTIYDLQQQIAGFSERIKSKETADLPRSLKEEKEVSVKYSDEKVLGLRKELNSLVQELINKELEAAILAQVEKTHELEKETLSQLVEEKDQRIYDLQQLVASLEHEFESSTCSFSSQLSKMQAERNSIRESWEKIKTAEVLKEVEIQEKNLIITELEHDLSNLQQRVEQQERTLFGSRRERQKIEAELEEMKLKFHRLERELEEKQLKVNDEKVKILEDFTKLSGRIQKLSMNDMQLMENLGRVVQTMENDELRIETNSADDEYDQIKENTDAFSSPVMRKVEAIHNERSPLRTLNC